MSVLKNKQSGEVTLINTSVTATVSSYVLANSILVFSFKGGGSDARHSFVRGEKTNTTTLTFYKGNSGGTNCTIQWELLEFDADTDVQDISESGTGTQNTTITSVDTDAAFVVPSGVSNASDTTITDTYTAALEITSATNVQRRTGSSGSSATFAYQVVEQAGTHGTNSVQYFSRSAETGTSFNQTISSVTTSRTLIFGSGESNTSPWGYGQPFRMTLTSSTNVQGNRAGTSSWDPGGYVVEYQSDVNVQAGTQSFASSSVEQDVTISSLVPANSISQAGASACMGFALATHSYVPEANGENVNIKGLVETTTNLQLQRSGTFSTPTVDWQVMEADPDAVSIVQVNDTPTTASSTDGVSFSHTIGGNDNRILIVCVTTRGNAPSDTAVSCTYNGVSMLQAHTKVSGASFNVRATIFYLLEASLPSAGSYTVSVTTPTGTAQSTEAVAFSIREAHQQAPEATADSSSESSTTSFSTSVTSVTDEAFAIDCVAGDGSATSTPGTGMTERADLNPGSTVLASATRPTGLAEAWPMAWSFTNSFNRYAHAVVVFKAAPQGVVEQCAGTAAGSSSVSASLPVETAVAGDSDGVASVGGSLSVDVALEGQSDGATTLTPVLSAPVALVGQSDGVADVAGSLPVDTQLVGASDGVATVGATVQGKKDLAGQSDGAAVVSDADLPVTTGLDATVVCTGTVTGTLGSVFGATSAGSSYVLGTLQVATDLAAVVNGVCMIGATMRHDHSLNAQSDGVATVAGSLTILSEIIGLDGRADGASVVVADGAAFEVATSLLVGVPGQATVTGTLAPDRPVAGQADGVATVSGSLDVAVDVAGQADGVATVTSALGVLTELVAQADGVSAVSASLFGAVPPLQTIVTGQATVSGTLDVTTALAAAVSGVATMEGSLAVQTALTALSDGLADVTAELQKIRDLAGQTDGVADVAGTLLVMRGVEAAVTAAADVSGAVDVQTALEVAVAGVATVAAQLEQQVPINGSADGVALVAGVLNVLTALEGAAAGVTSVDDAVLGKLIPIESQADGVSEVTADMLNFVLPEGQADGVTGVSGSVNVRTALEAAVAGVATPTASLQVAVQLLAESLGLSAPAGTLAIDGLGLGPARARGRARVAGELTVVRFVSSHSGKDDPRIITRTL